MSQLWITRYRQERQRRTCEVLVSYTLATGTFYNKGSFAIVACAVKVLSHLQLIPPIHTVPLPRVSTCAILFSEKGAILLNAERSAAYRTAAPRARRESSESRDKEPSSPRLPGNIRSGRKHAAAYLRRYVVAAPVTSLVSRAFIAHSAVSVIKPTAPSGCSSGVNNVRAVLLVIELR